MTFTTPPHLLRRSEWPDPATLPTMYDLPSDNPEDPGLPDEFHDYQPDLLSATFKLQNYTSENSFSAADLNLYYDPEHNWYKRPDWFGVLGKPAGCESDELRLSYVIWQEKLSPFVVVELISPGTENEDFGRTLERQGKPPTKWTVYEQILQVPYYIIYDRYDDILSGFRLVEGQYQPIEIAADRKIWLAEANAGLGLWQGKYKRFTRTWLRWYDQQGWIPTEAEQAQLEVEQAQLEAEKTQLENQKLKAKLKELGVDISDL
jgi:Uma2 family endonuclease